MINPNPVSETKRPRRWLSLISWALFAAALWVIGRELRMVGFAALWNELASLPARSIILIVLLTPAAYLMLTGYDLIAFRYIGRDLPLRRIVLAAFIGYAYSNSISMTPSIAVRYRLYSQWGVSTADIGKVIFFHYVSTWVGFFVIGGLILLIEPGPIAHAPLLAPDYRRGFGVALLIAFGIYLWLGTRQGLELRVRKLVLPFPKLRIVIPQVILAAADWALMGAIPYVLLPLHGRLSYVEFVSVFLLAQIAQILSHVPGGIGVFEGVLILLLKPYAPSASVLAALLVYRAVFMIMPLAVASVLLAANELGRGRENKRRPREGAAA